MMRWIAMMAVVLLAACGRQPPAPAHIAPAASTPVASTSAGKTAPAPQSPLGLLVAGIGDRHFVLLGEMHGTRETPALVGDLVAHDADGGEPVILGLEISTQEQLRVDRFLDSQGSPSDRKALLAGEHWQDKMHDGRDSAAMLGLIERIRQLRAAGRDVRIVAFDRPCARDRNACMADVLRETRASAPDARLIALMGNVHAMVRAPQWEMISNGERTDPPAPTGLYLADLHPLSINIGALRPRIWTCIDNVCGEYALGPYPGKAPAYESGDDPPKPWDAQLTLSVFTPSPPAITGIQPTREAGSV